MTKPKTWLEFNPKTIPVWVTIVWLFSILGYGAFRWHAVGGWPTPNTVGDFLAGAFSPVAFLWLILGYRQQGEELALNTKAINDQVHEQRESVRAQLELAKATREQTTFAERREGARLRREKRLAQPVIELTVSNVYGFLHDRITLQLKVLNVGAPCAQWVCHASDGQAIAEAGLDKFDRHQDSYPKLEFPGGGEQISIDVTFRYVDEEGDDQSQYTSLELSWNVQAHSYTCSYSNPRWSLESLKDVKDCHTPAR